MATLIQFLTVIAAILFIAGLIISTFGLFKSFTQDRFNRFIYLGLAVISTGALVVGLIFGVGYLQIRSAVNNINENTATSQDSTSYEDEEYVEEDLVEGDDDVEDIEDLGVFPEDFIPVAFEESGNTPECIPSEEASNFIAPFYTEPQSVLPDGTFIVASSDTTGYIVSDTTAGSSIVYVDTYSYQISAANDVSYDNTVLLSPEDEGYSSIDYASDAYLVAEGCVS